MANTPIKIKRSLVTNVPVKLNIGEPAYSYSSNTLFIGTSDSNGSIAIAGFDSFERSKSAYLHSNAAFIRANNSLNANLGGTVESTVTFLYDIVVDGDVVNKFRTVRVEANVITLNINVSSISQPTLNAGIEVSRGAQPNVFILWNEVDNKWQFTNDGIGYDDLGGSSASSYANSAFIRANAAYNQANTDKANLVNSGFTAQLHSNGAFAIPGTLIFGPSKSRITNQGDGVLSITANGQSGNTGIYLDNASQAVLYGKTSVLIQTNQGLFDSPTKSFTFNQNGTFTFPDTTTQSTAFTGYGTDNVARNTANASFVWANAAYDTANTKVSKSGDTMTGDLKFGGGGGILNLPTNQIAITASVDNDVSGFIAQATGVSTVYANTDVIIQANNGGSPFSQWYFNRDGTLTFPDNTIQSTAFIGYGIDNVARDTSNSAFIRANNSLDANLGGTVTANVVIAANLTTQNVFVGSYIDLNTSSSIPPRNEGRIFYDNDQKTLAYNNESDNTIQLGQETVIRVWNNSGTTIARGKVARIGGDASANGFPAVALASADSAENAEVIGVTSTEIANNDYGYITIHGKIRGLNTSLLTAGQELFLSDTPGEYQTTAPATPSVPMAIGYVTLSDVTDGSILVYSHLMEGKNKSNGAILFGRNGAIDQDPTKLYWDYVNDRLGIDTDNPQANLHVAGDGLFSGNVTISGNLVISNAQTITTDQLFIGGNNVILSANVTGTPSLNAAIIVNRGDLPNAFILWDETVNEWLAYEGTGEPGHIILANKTANSWAVYDTFEAYEKEFYPIGANLANSTNEHAKAGFATANIAENLAIASFKHANSGFIQANSSYAHANAAFNTANNEAGVNLTQNTNIQFAWNHSNSGFIAANSAGVYANGAFIRANTPSDVANSASIYANGAFVLANGTAIAANTPSDVANSASIYANGAFVLANGVAIAANTPSHVANSAAIYANGAFIAANTPSDVANSAAIYANGAFVAANIADDKAVTSGNYANAAFIVANSGFIQANAAFDHANSAFNAANNALDTWVRGQANAAFDQANAAFIHANSAFDFANGVAIAANTPSHVANSAAIYANGAFVAANSAGVYANGSFIAANTPSHVANSASIYANGAFNAANVATATNVTQNNNIIAAFNHANAAFDAANTGGGGSGADQYARDHANAAFIQANASYIHANSGFIHANSAYQSQNSTGQYANAAFTVANSAFIHANSGFIHANSAYQSQNATGQYANAAFIHANSAYESQNATGQYANAAFIRANNSVDSNTGGTITGDLTITKNLFVGNVYVTGQTFAITAGTLVSNDTVIILGSGNYSSDVRDLGFAGHYNDGTNAHSGIIRDSTTKEWYLFKGYTPEVGETNNVDINDPSFVIDTLNANLHSTYVLTKGIDLLPRTNIIFDLVNAAFVIANSGFIQANASFDHSNAAFNAANNALDTWVRGQANAAFDQANAAFIHANSAFDFANGVSIAANTPSHVANSASIYANGAFEQANAAVATNVTQNNSIIAAFNHANAAFEQANTGGGGGGADQYARDHANAAFDQANTDVTNISISSGTFGNANTISVVTVEANGRISSISNTDIGGNVNFFAIGVNTPPDSANAGSIRATGDVTAFYSDGRLKDVLGTISDPINKLMQLSGVLFINNDVAESHGYKNKNIQVGVIAQEVQNVLPEAVSLAPFDTIEDENGNQISRSGENYLTVKYEKIIPLLIESIKAQQIIIETLLKNKEE